MALVPVARFLIAGPGRIEGGVTIPGLENRMHELCRPEEMIEVLGPNEHRVVQYLRNRGRQARRGGFFRLADGVDERPRYRLWKPNPWIERKIQRMPSGRVLDLGCGCGREAVALACSGWQVTAIDHLPDAIERARDLESRYGLEGNPIRWEVGDACEAVGEYDVVLSLRFFSPKLIGLLPEVLVPGGVALIETFTEERREKTGRPASLDYILGVDQARNWPGMEFLSFEKTEEVRRYTLVRRDQPDSDGHVVESS